MGCERVRALGMGNSSGVSMVPERPDRAAEGGGSGDGLGSRILSEVFDEVRELAGAYMRRERPEHTLQATALVNEAYLRLERSGTARACSRQELLGMAARAMRQVLVDHARSAVALKRGGGRDRLTLMTMDGADGPPMGVDVLALDDALEKLGAQDRRLARIVELRFFGGMTIAETADMLDVSRSVVDADWAFARAWLRKEIEGGGDG